MRPEVCVSERAPGMGVADRTGFTHSSEDSASGAVAVCEQACGVEVAIAVESAGSGSGPNGARPFLRRSIRQSPESAVRAEERTSRKTEAGAGPTVHSRRVYLLVKTGIEWLVAAVLLVLTAPLLATFAILVKVSSPGPAFYFQTRLGRNGKAYRICKLRTMMHNCEAATGPVWAAKDDVRITPLGKILRDTHMDELPQLWNVLRGDMALIGPRPERPEIIARIERQIPDYRSRLTVRPGVTGLAQMRLPADTDLEGVRLKLAHDLYYIRNVSLIMDLRIAACTAFYFTAAAASALCNTAVGSYGRAVKARAITGDRAVEAA
jgi:lipopolysaccharide/colanic/teichoic acid biosynthesis glycosyltransferase